MCLFTRIINISVEVRNPNLEGKVGKASLIVLMIALEMKSNCSYLAGFV